MNKLNLRPPLNLPILESTSAEEVFQNQTLRPILKLQNEIYINLFLKYAVKQKPDYMDLSFAKKSIFIDQSLQKDLVLKNTCIGITLGMFMEEEMEIYLVETKSYNKRIIAMLAERLKNALK